MKKTPWDRAEKYRTDLTILSGIQAVGLLPEQKYGDPFGCFMIPSPCGERLKVILSTDDGWDHVSVSCKKRCPRWEEMAFIKDMFFEPDEVVMQLHVAKKDHINFHPYCLHLWRPHDAVVPLPPKEMIA